MDERAIRLVAGLISVVIITERIGLENFGFLSLNLLGYAMACTISFMGHESIILRRLVSKKERQFAIRNTIIIQIIACVLMAAPFFTIFYLLVVNDNFDLSFFLMLIPIMLCPYITFNQILYAEKKYKISALIGIIVSLSVLMIRFFAPSESANLLVYYVFTYCIEFSLLALLYAFSAIHISSDKLKSVSFWANKRVFNFKCFLRYARYGSSVWIGGLAHQFSGRYDQLLVAFLLDVKAVGIVALASKFVEGANGLIQSLAPIWQRLIYTSKDNGALKKNLSKVIVYGISATIFGYFVSVFGPYCISIFSSSNAYSEVIMIIWYHALFIPGAVLGIINSSLMFHLRSHDSAAFRVLVQLFCQLLGIMILVPQLGLIAIGPLNLISFVASSVLFNNFYSKGKEMNEAWLRSLRS